MISTYKYQGITWVDLESPSEDELLHILEEYRVPEHLIHELSTETILSKVDGYKDIIYLVLHFPCTNTSKKMPDLEVDFIVGKDFLITVHYEFSSAIYDFAQSLEVEAMLSRKIPSANSGHLFAGIIMENYHKANHRLDDLYQLLERAKDDIFRGGEDKMVSELSEINHNILDFKQALRFHDGVFRSFEKVSNDVLGSEFQNQIEAIRAEYHKLSGIIEGHREMLLDLRETNGSLLTAKTNKTMRVLTMMSFIAMPLTLLATILLLAADVHLLHTVEQFVYVVSIIVLIGTLMFLHFKHKKWLL